MKSFMKKTIAILLAAVMVFAFTACTTEETSNPSSTASSEPSGTEEQLKIGIIQYISHPSLDNCYQGVMEALEASSLNFTVDHQTGSDASADADCATYAGNMVAQNYDMIIAIATPAAISAYAATEGTDIPVIFCAVSDPVEAELVSSLENPGDLCTGTSDILDLSAQLDLIQAMQPDVETIGILYTTSEPNSISHLASFREIAGERGITIDAVGIQNDADIPAAAEALASRVDCINNFTDNKVVTNLSIVLDAANNAGIPVYGSEITQVEAGCLASVSIEYVALGRVTGEMAVDVLNGADITTMAVKTIADATPVVNTDVLETLNMSIPEGYENVETVTTQE